MRVGGACPCWPALPLSSACGSPAPPAVRHLYHLYVSNGVQRGGEGSTASENNLCVRALSMCGLAVALRWVM